jgi:hypothetical protein
MHKVLLPSLLFWVVGMQAGMHNAIKYLVQVGMQDAMKSLM